MSRTIERHVSHAKHVHARVIAHPKYVAVVHHSRTWMEILTCACTAMDTHFRPLAAVSVVWAIVDIVLVIVKAAD